MVAFCQSVEIVSRNQFQELGEYGIVLSMFRAFLATTPLPSFATPSLATYRIMGQQWV